MALTTTVVHPRDNYLTALEQGIAPPTMAGLDGLGPGVGKQLQQQQGWWQQQQRSSNSNSNRHQELERVQLVITGSNSVKGAA